MSTSLGWEGNRRSDVALAMSHRQQWFDVYPPTGSTAYEREMSTPPTLLRSMDFLYLYLYSYNWVLLFGAIQCGSVRCSLCGSVRRNRQTRHFKDRNYVETTWTVARKQKNKVALKGAWTGSYDPPFKFATAPTSQI